MRDLLRNFRSKGKTSTRFRIINAVLFMIVSVLISFALLLIFANLSDTVSKNYAELYSSNTVKTLNTYFGSQIALVSKAAHSKEVIAWFDDEYSAQKKLAAYEEMTEIINLLPNKSLYIGIDKTLHEFTVEENFTIEDVTSFATLTPGYFDDAWYFECIASEQDYLLNVDIDKMLQRKRVWLNCKVTRDNNAYGVLSTWLGFSDLAKNLFGEYDYKHIRGLVVDENGIIQMDSSLLGDENFLHYTTGNNEMHIRDKFSDPTFLFAFDLYTEGIDGYFDMESATTVIELSKGQYRYATIAPIAYTTWSVVTLYNASSLFSIANLLPLLIIIIITLIVFIVITNFTSNMLLFEPFEKMMLSIELIKANKNENVYGIERSDEIGEIAKTVQDMKDSLIDALEKAHYDALTGIYNRRYWEENVIRILNSLSRINSPCSNGMLSVLMIDIDCFKKYNDAYGHDMGDNCLRIIATILVNSVNRSDDIVARYGGEEFSVILPSTDENGARIVASRLLKGVRDRNIPHKDNTAADCVTISIGVTTGMVKYPQSGTDYIKRADEALYISKNTGRNKYTFMDFK